MIGWFNDNIGFMTAIVGLINIAAISVSPLIALKVQKRLDDNLEINERKMGVFRTLMATRAPANKISLDHVQALNMIDVIFYDDAEVRDAWSIYRDHLHSAPLNDTELPTWNQKSEDYFINLLSSMAKLLGYHLDKVLLTKGAYFPMAHGTINKQDNQLRTSLIEVFNGQRTLKVETICTKCANQPTYEEKVISEC